MNNYLFFVFLFVPILVGAQQRTPEQDSLIAQTVRKSKADHAYMLHQLSIKELRPGRSGNPNGINPANYEESEANPFPNLPDLLTLNNGEKVNTPKQWINLRRPEIENLFNEEIYGITPKNLPAVNWVLLKSNPEKLGNYDVNVLTYSGQVANDTYPSISVTIDLTITLPALQAQPVPVVMEFAFVFPPGFNPPPSNEISWKEQVIAKGWGAAVIIPTSYQADNGAGLTEGIIGLINQGKRRSPSDWGTLKAWGWGASKALDLMETIPQINAEKVAIMGHSRFGKAAAVTMAYDSRFAIAYIASSGEGGLKLHRRDFGEIVENIAGPGLYHWMSGSFLNYAGPKGWDDLPIDAHSLISLIAPRPFFIGVGANGDNWTDPKGMFMAAAAAEPVYQLLGKIGIGTSAFPAVEELIDLGEIGFRLHPKGHVTGPNWPYFIEFMSKKLDLE